MRKLDMTFEEFKLRIQSLFDNPSDEDEKTVLEHFEEMIGCSIEDISVVSDDETMDFVNVAFIKFNDGVYRIPYWVVVDDYQPEEINFQFQLSKVITKEDKNAITKTVEFMKRNVAELESVLAETSE